MKFSARRLASGRPLGPIQRRTAQAASPHNDVVGITSEPVGAGAGVLAGAELYRPRFPVSGPTRRVPLWFRIRRCARSTGEPPTQSSVGGRIASGQNMFSGHDVPWCLKIFGLSINPAGT